VRTLQDYEMMVEEARSRGPDDDYERQLAAENALALASMEDFPDTFGEHTDWFTWATRATTDERLDSTLEHLRGLLGATPRI